MISPNQLSEMPNDASKKSKKKYKWFIGIDVSKNKLDYAVLKGSEYMLHHKGQNTVSDVTIFCKELKKITGFSLSKALFCMEHTGFYCNPSLQALYKLKADVVCEHPLRIKRSAGLLRGKNDKDDAIRIAIYAEKNWENLRVWQPRRPQVIELMYLSALRSRLLGISIMLMNPLNEQVVFVSPKIQNKIRDLCAQTNQSAKAELEVVDKSIKTLITSDEHLNRLMKLITSVKCVGPITAVEIILGTNEFTDIKCPKKFACYAGVAPFKEESGTIIRRARVSHIANKRTKSLLHICAVNAIRFDSDLKAYYTRKTKSDGKPKMLVLNAVRYKLILRIFACLSQNRVYDSNYNSSKAINSSVN